MVTSDAIFLFIAVVTVVVLFVIWRAASVFFRFRGVRLVSCPETNKPAAVQVDAEHAAISDIIAGTPALQLSSCSRWPERRNCRQECLAEIEASPESCLVRKILTRWYEGKSCVYCGTSLGSIDWLAHRPALMSPERITFEWKEIPPEKVPEVLETHRPVCWDCHIAETFRRRFPDLVTDRPWKPGEGLRSR